MYKKKLLDLDETDLVPTRRASKLAESQSLISTRQLGKDGGGKEP